MNEKAALSTGSAFQTFGVAVATAMLAVQGSVEAVKKNAKNPHLRNKYADINAILEVVKPPCQENGLLLIQRAGGIYVGDDGKTQYLPVETVVIHAATGESINCVVPVPIEKPTAQGQGSAYTYGRRYGLNSLFALETEDDDGNAASVRRGVSDNSDDEDAPAPRGGGGGFSGRGLRR